MRASLTTKPAQQGITQRANEVTIDLNDVSGIVAYCMCKVEEIDGRKDLGVEKKTELVSSYMKEVRGFVCAYLQYKKLMAKLGETCSR